MNNIVNTSHALSTATATVGGNDNIFAEFPDLLTMDNLQKALGIGRTTAYRLINDNKIKHLRIGNVIKIPKLFLIDFVEKSCYNDCG